MRFFGYGKKRLPETTQISAPDSDQAQRQDLSVHREIVVYGSSDGARCKQLRALLERHSYTYQDVRVDEDLGTRAWLQRTTGDAALPKIFIGPQCYGGLETVQVLVFDGSFDRLLRGEASQPGTNAPSTALKEEMTPLAVATLLRQGEVLTITEGEMAMDTWAEPLANPPLVYHEGVPHPIEALEGIAQQIVTRFMAGEIQVRWKEDT